MKGSPTFKMQHFFAAAFISLLCFVFRSRVGTAWNKDTMEEVASMMGFSPHGEFLPVEDNSPHLEFDWDEAAFDKLPQPVKRYLHRAFLFTGEPQQRWKDNISIIQSVICEEEGNVLLNNEYWAPFKATRYISASPLHAGFVWDAIVSAPSSAVAFGVLSVRDSYANDKEVRTSKLLGAFPISNLSVPEEAETPRLRWLAYCPLFPTSLLPNDMLPLKWIQTGKQSAIAELADPDSSSVSKAEFHFDKHGLVQSIVALGRKDKWHFRMGDYKVLGHGMLIPTRVEVGIERDDGTFVPQCKVHINNMKHSYL